MIILVVLIFFGVCIYFAVDLIKKEEEQKRHIMVLTRQNNKMKKALKGYSDKKEERFNNSVVIKYIPVKSKNGVVSKNTKLYIAPVYDSYILTNVQSGTNIKIIDSGQIENNLWYEVMINLNIDTNNKGWIPSSDLILEEDIIEPK
ncbi:hypothetical protein BJV85_000669 [Clostridium acetobutylicum]|uniref:SH3b domain-containing protein n=2 Tax=Clostridium acetobutylicum TaxID=1488 RepID=Q97E83_CLOAB|nr:MULTISPECIES: hypothetical protein [Clostridium]AAK81167.1 Hypothetical protein CA_C3232 [Clostridium acetobutylicum ATCC 824]ADZ22272.1 Conserved hypothetical protein [Clostridium acetobutylicum EA 2018]AEI32721.1 hypothetical protein SMB_G3268 [Clostridium acetobutylicum DSM 1731]AWV81165.1 hypothetical protein DK921_13860 [Clostridium acetobutylicum]MBC2395633.1 hypothetical protein [Clostridium acetobutylicum]